MRIINKKNKMDINKAILKEKIEHIIAEGLLNVEELDVTTSKVMSVIEPIVDLATNDRKTFNKWLSRADSFYIGDWELPHNPVYIKIQYSSAKARGGWVISLSEGTSFLSKKDVNFTVRRECWSSINEEEFYKEFVFNTKEEALDFAKKHLNFFGSDLNIEGFEFDSL